MSAAAVQRDGGRALLVNDEVRGIDIHDFDGDRRARLGRAGLTDLDARSGLDWPGGRSVVVASIDEPAERPVIFTAVGGVFSEAKVRGLDSLDFPPDALCLYKDERESTLYLFLLDGAGMAEQWLLHPGEHGIEALAVRMLPVGGDTKGCHVDDARGRLYVVEEDMAVWQWDAPPVAPGNATATGPSRAVGATGQPHRHHGRSRARPDRDCRRGQ
ncbi:phytase [Guyparkeria sp.]|uniref:phytase n=1 Tax=Guyparkeria sp. TaxID=2035736 RepID=UPI003970A4FC